MNKYDNESQISIELLEKLYTYDPDTGELRHKTRGLDMFINERAYKSWNTRFAGQEAKDNDPTNDYMRTMITLNKKKIRLFTHRIVWALYYKEWPSDQIDHINGRGRDNRLENLRVVSHQVNQRNRTRPINNKTGHIGVHFDTFNKKYRACIKVNDKSLNFKRRDTLEEALADRKAAEKEYGFHANHGREKDGTG
jgi:hypothetical protein